jgi:hypothetical protein
MSKAHMLLKLSVDKDLRTVDKIKIEKGRISYFFTKVKENLSELFKVELLLLVFALPLIAVLGFYILYKKPEALSDFTFANFMGIGYTDAVNTEAEGIAAIYSVFREMLLWMVPAFTIFGFGAAGAFYCSRGYMWSEPVVVRKAFFRGIKKLWKYYVPIFAVIGALVTGLGTAILTGLEDVILGTAGFWSYFMLIGGIVIGVIGIMYLIMLLPMFACYKFKLGEYLKNAVLLNMLMLPPTLILAAVTVAPFVLFRNGFAANIFYVVFAIIGIVFIIMMWTAYAQNVYEVMIEGMYQARIESEKKKKAEAKAEKSEKLGGQQAKKPQQKQQFVNPKKKKNSGNKK